MLTRVAQGQHRGLRTLEERYAGLGQRVNDLGVEVAAGEGAEGDHDAVGAVAAQRFAHRAAELSRGRQTAGLRNVDAQVHGEDVDGLVAQQRVEELREEPGILVHGAGAVERIAGVREVRHEAPQALDRGGRQRRQLHAGSLGSIGGATALASEAAQDSDAPSARIMARRRRQERQRVDHLVDARHLDDTALPEHRLDDLGRPGQRAGVGEHGLPGVLGPADFQDDDGLAQLAGARGRPPEPLGLLEPLDEGADDGGVLVLDQKLDVVLDREAGLVAARHDVAQPDVALLHQVLADRVAEAAALRDEADAGRAAGARPRPR